MEGEFEKMSPDCEYKRSIDFYNKRLEEFIQNSSLRFHTEIAPEQLDKNGTFSGVGILSSNTKKLEALRLLEDSVFLNSFFLSKGYEYSKPRPIINRNGITLFISAGVQILDGFIHEEEPIPANKLWVAQPVFRTQYIDQISEGFSTSFINLATLSVNLSIDEHFHSIHDWFQIMERLGFEKEKFAIKAIESKPQWGNKKFDESILMIYYNGVEIGDANYIHNMPQKSRAPLKISDIGFGLERMKWVLRGGSYFDFVGTEEIQTVDICKTMALLSGSGLVPSNSNHGYRLRQLSKKLISLTKSQEKIDALVKFYYNFWKKWIYLTMPEIGAVVTIKKENVRNLNIDNEYD